MSETRTGYEPQLSAEGFGAVASEGMLVLRRALLPEETYDLMTAVVAADQLDSRLKQQQIRVIGTEATAGGIRLDFARQYEDGAFGRGFCTYHSTSTSFVQQDLEGIQVGLFDMKPDGTGNVHAIVRGAFELRELYPGASINPAFTVQSIEETLAAAEDFTQICHALAAIEQ